MKVLIYTLTDPNSLQVRYVGKTTRSLNRRWHEHLRSKNKSHTVSWIKSLLNKDQRPIIELLDESSQEMWQIDEKYWISQFKSWGFNLTNDKEGGQGGTHSEETRQKMSKTRKGRKYSWGDKISASLKGTREGVKRGSYKLSDGIKNKGDKSRKHPKPLYSQLAKDLEELKIYSEIAKKYNVNRSVTEGWFKYYKRYGEGN